MKETLQFSRDMGSVKRYKTQFDFVEMAQLAKNSIYLDSSVLLLFFFDADGENDLWIRHALYRFSYFIRFDFPDKMVNNKSIQITL